MKESYLDSLPRDLQRELRRIRQNFATFHIRLFDSFHSKNKIITELFPGINNRGYSVILNQSLRFDDAKR